MGCSSVVLFLTGKKASVHQGADFRLLTAKQASLTYTMDKDFSSGNQPAQNVKRPCCL